MNILHGALAKLVRQCMDRAGIPMPTAPPVSQGIPKNERRYGLSDPRKAASYGYHLAPEEKPIPDNQKLSKDQQKALAGTQNGKTGPGGSPPEGCTANAANQITGTPYYPSDALIVRQLSVDSFDNSKQDPRVVSVIDEWAMCMKGKGFPYSSPLESVNVMTRDDEPSTEEISVARADVTCKESTNLIQVWLAVESEIQNRLIGQHESELNAATLEINEMVGRATEVMSQNR